MSNPTPIVVCGAGGRMGRLLVALAAESGLRVAAAIEAEGVPLVGRDAGEVAGVGALGVSITTDLAAACAPDRVVIEFTGVAAAAVRHAEQAAARGAALVVGTTGLDAAETARLQAAANTTRSVIAANFSVGVTVLLDLVQRAATLLDAGFEAEIVELHHHAKKDAPSGTALALGRAITDARRQSFDGTRVLAREGLVGARRRDEVGIMGLRAGDAVGDHTVLFGGLGERIELIHRAQSRECLVRGALRAAAWISSQAPGVYGMRNVLGL